MAEGKASRRGGDFDKVEVNRDTQWCTESILTGRGGGVCSKIYRRNSIKNTQKSHTFAYGSAVKAGLLTLAYEADLPPGPKFEYDAPSGGPVRRVQ